MYFYYKIITFYNKNESSGLDFEASCVGEYPIYYIIIPKNDEDKLANNSNLKIVESPNIVLPENKICKYCLYLILTNEVKY